VSYNKNEKKRIDILLVEDRMEDAELIKIALAKNNIRWYVYWLKDGKEALAFLDGLNDEAMNNLRLILLDLNIPKIDGIKVLEKIKQSNLRHIPVVMLTTSKHENDLTLAYKNHVNSYILKPVNFDEFVDTISCIGNYWMELNTSKF
jgi:two-component system response regulator